MADTNDVEPVPESSGVAIVMIGDFNPAILHPSWFRANGLMRPDDADSAEIEVVAREVASFSLSWVGVQATLDRFQLASSGRVP